MSCKPLIFGAIGRLRKIIASAAIFAIFGICAQHVEAGPREDIFYWASADEFNNVSHYFDFRPDAQILSRLVWDRLYYRDPNSPAYKPNLATRLVWNGVTSVDIELRRDVIFHNGDRFTADDIIETVRRLKNPSIGAPGHRGIEWIGQVQKLSRFKVRFDLKRPTPHLLEILSGPFVVIPRTSWLSAPLDGTGKIDYSLMPPVGSGPYRVTRIDPGKRIELDRFSRYHKSPKGRPLIKGLIFSSVSEPRERRQQLMDGRLDFLWRLSKAAVDRMELEGAPVSVRRAPSMRFAFLLIDRAGRNGQRSPFRNLLVRRGIAHAVNRSEIARLTFGDNSKVLHSLCHPSQFGCEQDVRRYEYDSDKAIALLRSASIGPASKFSTADQKNVPAERFSGKPSGASTKRMRAINTDIVSYRNHPVSRMLVRYLETVGIDARVDEFERYGTAKSTLESGDLDLAHMTWASYGSMDIAEILNRLLRNGPLDYCRDAEINRWLDVAAITNDRQVRARSYSNVLKRLQELVCVLPLFNYTTFYAHSKQLDFKPTLDDTPRLYRMKWK